MPPWVARPPTPCVGRLSILAESAERRRKSEVVTGRPAKAAHEHLEDGTFRARRHAELLDRGPLPTNPRLATEVRRYRRARLPERKYAIALNLERLQALRMSRNGARGHRAATSTPAVVEAFLVVLWNRLLPFLERADDRSRPAPAMIRATRETAAEWGQDEEQTLAYVARELRRDKLAFDFRPIAP